MNISNSLKKKVINHNKMTDKEVDIFLKYIIHKTIIITDHMYNKKNYQPIYLFHEICYSYNLEITPINHSNSFYSILNINNDKYLIDLDFNNNKLKELSQNKYIKYTDKVLQKYLELRKNK